MVSLGSQPATEIAGLVREDRIHRRVYTDPAIFEAEMARLFGRLWVFVGHESEVAQPGDYRTTAIGRQPVILSRHTDGQVYVLYNRCMHRGAIVCREEAGNSKHFRCIYHGWTYRGDGTLRGVPWRHAYPPDFDLSQLGLMRVPRVASYRGFIFASLAPEGESLAEHLGPAARLLDFVVDRAPAGTIEVRGGVQKYGFPGNWKLQLENFMDHYHPPFTHESGLTANPNVVGRTQVRETDDGAITIGNPSGHTVVDFGPDVRWKNPPADYVAALEVSRGPARAEELLSRQYHLALFPNLLLQSSLRSYRVIRPLAVDRTAVFVYPYRLTGAPEALNNESVREVASWASATGAGQPDDLEVFQRVQEGLQAEGPEWLIVSRGLHTERIGQAGEWIGGSTDETPIRAQYRAWSRLMTAD